MGNYMVYTKENIEDFIKHKYYNAYIKISIDNTGISNYAPLDFVTYFTEPEESKQNVNDLIEWFNNTVTFAFSSLTIEFRLYKSDDEMTPYSVNAKISYEQFQSLKAVNIDTILYTIHTMSKEMLHYLLK